MEAASSQLAEPVVDEGHKTIQSPGVAIAPQLKQARDVGGSGFDHGLQDAEPGCHVMLGQYSRPLPATNPLSRHHRRSPTTRCRPERRGVSQFDPISRSRRWADPITTRGSGRRFSCEVEQSLRAGCASSFVQSIRTGRPAARRNDETSSGEKVANWSMRFGARASPSCSFTAA